jgi:hypothetical protein
VFVFPLQGPPNDLRSWRVTDRVTAGGQGARGAKPRLTEAQLRELQKVLEAGPAACGGMRTSPDAARITEVAHRRFGVDVVVGVQGWW